MKKKCLFFIQGEGRGHCTQAISLKQILDDIDIEVIGVYIGKNHMGRNHDWVIKEMNNPINGNYYSPNFVYHNNKISLFRTALKAIKNVSEIQNSIKYIKRLVRLHKPDFIVNFYEPLVGIAMRNNNVPVVTIGHQFMIDHPKYPKQLPVQRFLISTFNKLVAGTSKYKFALSYYPTYDYYDIRVSPPLLRKDVLNANPVVVPHKVTAYVVNSYLVDNIKAKSKVFGKTKNFVIYNESIVEKTDNIECKKVGPEFIDDMLNSEYVICSGGFETICESVYLNKKILAVPVENHAEQILNTIDASDHYLIHTNNNYDMVNLFTDDDENSSKYTCRMYMKYGPDIYKRFFKNVI
jgi:uncharacterized protein (TIGR00661 family)